MPWSALTDLANDYGLPSIIILATFGVLKIYQSYISKAEKARVLKHDEIELLSKILSYEGKDKKFLIEQFIEAKYQRPLSWREISFLMKQVSPSEALTFYASAANVVEFKYSENEPSYLGKFDSDKYRNSKKFWHVSLYFFFAFLVVFLLWASPFAFEIKGIAWGYLLLLGLCPFFALFALLSLREYAEIKFGEKLMDLIALTKNNPDKSSKHLLL